MASDSTGGDLDLVPAEESSAASQLGREAVADGLEEEVGAVRSATLGANGRDHMAVVFPEREESEEDFRGDTDARTESGDMEETCMKQELSPAALEMGREAVADGLEEEVGAVRPANLGANCRDHTAVVLPERESSEEDFRGDADARTGEQSVRALKGLRPRGDDGGVDGCPGRVSACRVGEGARTSEIPRRGFPR